MRKRFLFLVIIGISTITGFSQINSNNPTIPFGSNTAYQYGLMPTGINMQTITNAYNSWKNTYVVTCTNGRGARVRFDNQAETVSEGVAYGMLLAVYAGDKPLFDNLWTYYTSFLNGNGLMHWKIDGCNNANGFNGATDADLDAAMALILAREQWPNSTSPHNYQVAATNLLNSIRNHEINPSNYQTLNGDAWFNNNCLNPSYQSPAYYRQFGVFQSNQAGFWSNVTNAAESLLLANRNPNNGLVGNWCDAQGVSNSCANTTPNEYGWDAIRTPWRMTVDVLWHGPQTATAAFDICTKMTGWLTGHETNIRLPMPQNAANAGAGQWKNGGSLMSGLVAMAAGTQQQVNTIYNEAINVGTSGYFNDILRMLTLFTFSGNFWAPGASGAELPPLVQNLTTNAAGEKIIITFSQEMANPATGAYSAFTLRKNGVVQSNAFTAITRTSPQVYELTLAASAYANIGEILTLSYSPGTIQGSNGIALAAFTNSSVTNALAGNSTLISGCEHGNRTFMGTYWYAYTDADVNGASTITHPSSIDPFLMTVGGAAGTDSALRVSTNLSQGGWLYDPFVGFGFNTTEPEGGTFDFSAGTGFSFWHKGDPVTFSVGIDGVADGEYHSYNVLASVNWQLVEVSWTELSQPSWLQPTARTPFDPSIITKLQWQIQAATGTSHTVWIDEVILEGAAITLPGLPTGGEDPDVVSKTTLLSRIAIAETKVSTAVAGTDPGNYPQSAITALSNQIAIAQAVANNDDAAQIEVNEAVTALNSAIATFDAAQVPTAGGGNTLIADCEDENVTKLQTYWYSYAAGASTITPLASETVPFTMTAGGANGTAHAAVVSGNLVTPGAPAYESAGIGFALAEPEADYDLTGATGISFYHRGDAINFSVIISTTLQDAGHDYGYAVPASANWQLVTVNFPGQGTPAISQPGWAPATPWDASKVTKLQWQVKDGIARSYSFAIDEVTVIGKVLDLPDPVDPVDKTLLAAAITSATTLHSTAVEGSLEGQYPVGSKATLLLAINDATAVNNDPSATQTQVDAALIALNAAVATFQASANGAPPAGNTLIADCEDENVTKLQTYWYSYAAGASTITPLASETVPFTMTAGGANGTAHAAVVSGELVNTVAPDYESAGIGFALAEPEADYDLTGATGISFYHRGDAINFSVIISITEQDAGHDYSYAVPASANWQLVTVNFPGQGTPAISQPGWAPATPWDASKVTKLQWQVKDGVARSYSFAIDEVTVIGKVLDLPDPVDPVDPVVKTALLAKIVEAEGIRDAASFGTQPGQYPVSAGMTFENAISAAQFVANSTTATQAEVDQAVLDLDAAIAAFEASVNPEPSVDVTALTAKITEANTTLSSASIGTLEGQHPQSAADDLSTAIATAQALVNNPTTQAAVNNMVTTLNTAITTFLQTTNPPVGANTLIADCEDENVTKLQTYWYSYAAGASTITPLASETVPFTMTAGGANGTAHAAVVSGELVNTGAPDYESAGIGFALAEPEADYDLTGATGISFYHRGDAVNFSVIISSTVQDAGHDYSYAVPASANWQLVTVNFPGEGTPAISQPGWAPATPWDASKVTKLQWQVKDGVARSYSFAIDEVTVMGKVLDLPDPVDPVDPVVKTALLAKIVEAEGIRDAASFGTQPGQYPVSAGMTFENAISAAQFVANSTTATQAEVDQAVITLQTAIATFEASVNQAPVVNKTTLLASLANANSIKDAAIVGTQPGQYPSGAYSSFTTAITNAQIVADNPTATQAQVDQANTTLLAAIATFEASVNPELNVDVTALTAKITEANTTLSSASIGTLEGQHPQSAANDLSAAIATAQALANNPTTQTAVNNMVTTLNNAITTFLQTTNPPEGLVNKTTLANTIQTAQYVYNSAVEGSAEGQYAVGAKANLHTAITAAQAVHNNVNATQTMVNQAVTDLENALTLFQSQLIGVDKSELQATINQAQVKHDNGVEGILPGQYAPGAKQELYFVINSAQSVLISSSATQVQINQAVANLVAAMAEFDASVNPTTVSKIELEALVAQAESLYYDSPYDYPLLEKVEFSYEIQAARAILENLNSLQYEINTAVINLQNAITRYENSQLSTSVTAVDAISVQVYPNPFVSSITIESEVIISSITIVSNNGRIVASVPVEDVYSSISLDAYAAGVYTAHIIFADNSTKYVQVIKQ